MKRRIPRAVGGHGPVHNVSRNPMCGFPADVMLEQIRRHVEAGERVRVSRSTYRAYDVVQNGGEFLVLPALGGPPIGTYPTVAAAVLAGDAYVEAVRRGEFDDEDDDYPRGAA